MNVALELKRMREAIASLHLDIAAMEAVDTSEPNASMAPTQPLRHHRHRAVGGTLRTFMFTYLTTTTSSALEPRAAATRKATGLNQLDAEIHLRQRVRKSGLYLRAITSVEPA